MTSISELLGPTTTQYRWTGLFMMMKDNKIEIKYIMKRKHEVNPILNVS